VLDVNLLQNDPINDNYKAALPVALERVIG
jgi:hypothetical protein